MIAMKGQVYGEMNDENTVLSADTFDGRLVVGAGNKALRNSASVSGQGIYIVSGQGHLQRITLGPNARNQVIATSDSGYIILMDKSLVKL